MKLFTDQGIADVISNNHGLKEIQLHSCYALTDASFITIADNCHKLSKISISEMEMMMKDRECVALVSSNHDLEEIFIKDRC